MSLVQEGALSKHRTHMSGEERDGKHVMEAGSVEALAAHKSLLYSVP